MSGREEFPAAVGGRRFVPSVCFSWRYLMKTKNLKGVKGMVVAAGVLSLLATGYGVAGSTGEKGESKTVKCYGINSCSGKGECGAKDGSHDCAGKNTCKGKGWVKTTEEECEEKGGEILGGKKE